MVDLAGTYFLTEDSENVFSSNRYLIRTDLSHVSNLVQCTSCSKPTLKFKNVTINNLSGFHIMKAKNCTLCIATSKQVIIMEYDLVESEFAPLRVLDTAEPTSCLLFTDHSLIIGANKYFEVDLKTFTAEEFLDNSDVKLSQATRCYKMGSFPLAIFQVSNLPILYET